MASFHAPVVRQRFLEPAYGPLRERVLGRCRTILVSSAQMATAPELAGSTDAVQVLPYGVSPSLAPSNELSRPPDHTTLRLLFVGRLVYYKGLDVLLHAVARTTDRPVRLTIVGEGPLRPELEALVARLGVQDRVELAGAVDDAQLLELYRSHDVFVMPSGSRAETFGMAMCEAMAAGLPAVSTSVGTGTDWVNLDGVTGLVVPPGDPVALAEALHTLAADPDLVARLGQGGASAPAASSRSNATSTGWSRSTKQPGGPDALADRGRRVPRGDPRRAAPPLGRVGRAGAARRRPRGRSDCHHPLDARTVRRARRRAALAGVLVGRRPRRRPPPRRPGARTRRHRVAPLGRLRPRR